MPTTKMVGVHPLSKVHTVMRVLLYFKLKSLNCVLRSIERLFLFNSSKVVLFFFVHRQSLIDFYFFQIDNR